MNILEMLLGGMPAQAKMDDTLDKDPRDMAAAMSPKQPVAPIDDGGFTRNILMKGIPGMEDKSPSFTGINGVAWTPTGPQTQAAPLQSEDLPPSPLAAETQYIMPSAKQEMIQAAKPKLEPVQQQAVQQVKKANAKQAEALTEEQKPEEAPVEEPKSEGPSVLDKLLASYNEPQTDSELAQAQSQRNELMRQLSMLKSMQEIGAGLGGYRADKDFLSSQMELAGMPVKDIEQRREQERKMKAEKGDALKMGMDVERFKMDSEAKGIDLQKAKMQLKDASANKDPMSDISKATREAVKQRFQLAGANVKVPDNLSADQVKSLYPMGDIVDDLLKQRTAKEAAADRREAKAEKLEQQKKDKLDKYIGSTREKVTKEADAIQKGRAELTMLESALSNPSAVKDTAALYSMIKSFDPESVVREGEVALAMKGTSLWDNANTLFSKLKKNDTRLLQPGYIKQIYDYANQVQKIRDANYRTNMDSRLNFARKRMGLGEGEEEYIDPLFKSVNQSKTIIKKQYSPSRNQTRIQYSDGSEEIKDGKQ